MSVRTLPAVLCFTVALTAVAFQQEHQPDPKEQPKPDEQAQPSAGPLNITLPPPPADPNDFKVSSDVELVLLDVSVKDSEGGFVSGLKKESFRIFENKTEQPIVVFGAQDVPVTVGLVVDNSGSVRPKRDQIVTAALNFVSHSNPKDEIFVVNFNDRVSLGLPPDVSFSGEKQTLRDALINNPSQGRTALYDAIRLALEHLEKGRLDKKTLVIISDGGDNASDLSRDEIMHLIDTSLATVYTVGIFNPMDKDKNPGFLKAVARISGGEAFMPRDILHLTGVCEKIAKDIRNRYTLGFSPQIDSYDGKPRKLRVEALAENGRKLEVRTRTHYIASAKQESRTRTKEESGR